MFAFLASTSAHAVIYWAGGEDLDFTNGAQVCSNTNGSLFRSSYARMGLYTCGGGIAQSNAFQAGGFTNLWLSAQVSISNNWVMLVGLGKMGSGGSLWLGNSQVGGNWTQIALWTYNSGTWARLAYETGTSLNYGGHAKVDMQVINYGASGTVNVYVNGSSTAAITYTGNIVTGANTSLDSVVLEGISNEVVSEIMVSDSDTRLLSLATLVPNGAGGTNQWTGTYANINPIAINDSSMINDNNSGDIFPSALSSAPSGGYAIQAIKVAARAAGGTSGLTSVSVGIKTNGSTNSPAAVPQSMAFGETETYFPTNPVTSTNWAKSDLSTLQLNFTSAP